MHRADDVVLSHSTTVDQAFHVSVKIEFAEVVTAEEGDYIFARQVFIAKRTSPNLLGRIRTTIGVSILDCLLFVRAERLFAYDLPCHLHFDLFSARFALHSLHSVDKLLALVKLVHAVGACNVLAA